MSIVAPWILSGDLHGSIGGFRVDDDEFVGDVLHRGEALTQEALLVFHDHADAQPGLPVGFGQFRTGNRIDLLSRFAVEVEGALWYPNPSLRGKQPRREI